LVILKEKLLAIKMTFEESIKQDLKILWTIKPRKLKRSIKHLIKNINDLSYKCEKIKLELMNHKVQA
jgi:hypothetical protein